MEAEMMGIVLIAKKRKKVILKIYPDSVTRILQNNPDFVTINLQNYLDFVTNLN